MLAPSGGERGDGVAIIKRRRQDPNGDGVRDLVTASRRGRLKKDLESSTWQRRQDFKATSSRLSNVAIQKVDEVIGTLFGASLDGKGLPMQSLRSEAIEGCDQKPLEAAITKPADLKVIIYGYEDVEGCCGEEYLKSWFGTEGRLEDSESFETCGSFVDRLSISVIDLMTSDSEPELSHGAVTSRKAKVKRWMFKGVKAFSHVNFDEYICVVGFDEVLVAESNMTKITKKRWFSLVLQCRSLVRLRRAFSRTEEDLLKLLEMESRSASKWEIVEL
ncbi:hypothetical protein Tco_1166016 [Tanacetum coccineum]